MGGRSAMIKTPARKPHRPSFVCFSKSAVELYPETVDVESESEKGDSPVSPMDVNALFEEKVDVRVEVILRSCIRKPGKDDQDLKLDACVESAKGRVKWVDSFGKELVEINEYESGHYGDSRYDSNPSCVCSIQ
ncbi:uncharacterized protein LOC144702738 [Wolffia australiana]